MKRLTILLTLVLLTMSLSTALAQAPEGKEYIVQAGDSLSAIAAREYGNPQAFPAIVESTNAKAAEDASFAVINDPAVILVGQKLWLPAQPQAGEPAEAAATAPAGPPSLTATGLANATYSGIYTEPVTLTGGRYEGEPFAQDDSSRPVVEYLGEEFGDLDGDGLEDAAVFLVESSGGTGNFVYVAAQLNQNGQPVDAGAVMIEDRIQIISVAIENGQIQLEITAEGSGDAACCKSHKTTKTYALQDDQLAEIPGEEAALEKISAADLNGTAWTLVELNVDQPVLTDTVVSLSFADGQLNGSAGCNTYNSSFTLDEVNPSAMTIGPVVSTKMACPEPILGQETAYLAALQGVSQWGYVIGDLAMYYDDGQGAYAGSGIALRCSVRRFLP